MARQGDYATFRSHLFWPHVVLDVLPSLGNPSKLQFSDKKWHRPTQVPPAGQGVEGSNFTPPILRGALVMFANRLARTKGHARRNGPRPNTRIVRLSCVRTCRVVALTSRWVRLLCSNRIAGFWTKEQNFIGVQFWCTLFFSETFGVPRIIPLSVPSNDCCVN